MQVKVRFHGIVSDMARKKDQAIEIEAGATVADLTALLATQNDGFGAVAKQVRAVVNGETAGKETALTDGDEIVFMRAIGGGS